MRIELTERRRIPVDPGARADIVSTVIPSRPKKGSLRRNVATETERKEWEQALDVLVDGRVTDPTMRAAYGEIVHEHVAKIETMFVRLGAAVEGVQKKAATGGFRFRETVLTDTDGTLVVRVTPDEALWLEEMADRLKAPGSLVVRAIPAEGTNPDAEFALPAALVRTRALVVYVGPSAPDLPTDVGDREFVGATFLRGDFQDAPALAIFRYESVRDHGAPDEAAAPEPATLDLVPRAAPLSVQDEIDAEVLGDAWVSPTKRLLAAIAAKTIQVDVERKERGGIAIHFRDAADGQTVTVPA
jgi:hypothetical protein